MDNRRTSGHAVGARIKVAPAAGEMPERRSAAACEGESEANDERDQPPTVADQRHCRRGMARGTNAATGETLHRNRRNKGTDRKPCGTHCGAQARSVATAAPHKGETQGIRIRLAEGTTIGNFAPGQAHQGNRGAVA